jgi:hypothetical protein
VVAYARSHPDTYPCEPTLQQLYDTREFEAYHELGAAAVALAEHDGGLGESAQNQRGLPSAPPSGPAEQDGRELTTTSA